MMQRGCRGDAEGMDGAEGVEMLFFDGYIFFLYFCTAK